MLLEEDVRDLMNDATSGVTAPSHVGTAIASEHRRRRTRRTLTSLALTGVTVGAVAVAAYPHGAGTGPGSAQLDPVTASPSTGAISLTAAQRTLIGLSQIAARTEPATGRYVVMSELQDQAQRTSVIDAITGDVWTYQKDPGIPSELPVARHDSLTEAQFAAIPTDARQLRTYLIAQFDRDQQLAGAAESQQLAGTGKTPAPPLVFTADDKVFEQATDMLWNPVVGPQLRSALFKVLAATSDVQVDRAAKDAKGRPAIKVSRYNPRNKVTDATFENPKTSEVLQTTFSYADGTVGSDLYFSTSRSVSLPANPYTG
ncbi:MAG TPA: hypothetical protein VHX15_14730 [Frankiaceae bacterium]|jgi:hypothetical protein|nr:hypothetical protein [Frankiaceae bacterium]